MGGDKSHKKKKTNKKVQRKTHEKQKKAEGDGGKKVLSPEAARKQNPKAFIFSGSGKAKRNQARTAEKDQRRMHGQFSFGLPTRCVCVSGGGGGGRGAMGMLYQLAMELADHGATKSDKRRLHVKDTLSVKTGGGGGAFVLPLWHNTYLGTWKADKVVID